MILGAVPVCCYLAMVIGTAMIDHTCVGFTESCRGDVWQWIDSSSGLSGSMVFSHGLNQICVVRAELLRDCTTVGSDGEKCPGIPIPDS
jgi:hypothetical protein